MASTLTHSQQQDLVVAFRKVQVTILASEWGSSKGGLSTISRELAIQLAKFPEVEITVFLLRCSEEDRSQALKNNVTILEATRRPGYDELDWLSFPPEHLQIDVIVGHGVKLGRQAQVIKELKQCRWVQVVHTDPEELGMFKSYSNPISKGQEKHKIEVELCEMADLVVGVGPKLSEAFRSYLRGFQKDQNVVDFTPGVFDEFSSVKQSPNERKQCSILVFGRGDDEDFELKGFDIAGKAVAALPDTRLVFVGAQDGKHEEIKEQLIACGVSRKNLRVRDFVQNREDLKRLFCEVDLVLMPSRTEGFGLTGLEALSSGLPVLVSQNSGFGEALSKVPFGSSFVIDSDNPKLWAVAIQNVWGKDRQGRLEEAETLRTCYEKKYSWGKQSTDLVDKMISLVNGTSDSNTVLQEHLGTKRRASCLQGVISSVEENVKSLKSNQGKVTKGLTQVEAEKKSFSVPRVCCEIASCEGDIALFAGRHHRDTRKWLFEDFDRWFNNPGISRAYVLLGDAGVGKSVVAGTLAQRMMKDGLLGAAYFCRHYDGTRNDPRNLLGTIACQLCDCNSEYSKRMGGEDGVREFLADSNLGVQELCTKLLEEPLSKCSPFQRKLVVIDALDETEYKSRKDFIFLIKERFPLLPEWLVFFITSRPEDMVQSRLQRYNPCVRICAGNSEQQSFYQQHEQDIQRFLSNSVDFSRLPCSAEDVTKKCNGLFLYAFYVAKDLNSALFSGKIDKLSDLFPRDVDDFFQSNFQRVFDKVGADLYRKLLGCIMTAPSPLPVSFIPFVLDREMSDLDEQEVLDAVSQFVVLQETVTFLHNLIPSWLTNKRKAQKLYIDEKSAGEYFTGVVKEILITVLYKEEPMSQPVESKLQAFVFHFAVRLLCQHGENDSLKVVFRCLTSHCFLEERIRSKRFGIYFLLKDLQLAASCLAFEGTEKQNILQEISLAIESDIHVLIESPHLLQSCIQHASDVVQENVLIPQVSSPCLIRDIYDLPYLKVLSECNCFATAFDKQTVAGAKGRSLFFFDASVLEIVSGPFEIGKDTIAKINHLEFSSDDKFIFFGRLDKWFSVENGCVEDLPQFAGNDLVYRWGLITPNGRYIVVKTNVLHFHRMCEHGCCLTELVAVWAGKEFEQSRDEDRTCSFGQLSERIAGIGIMGRHTRYLMACLGVDPESYQTHAIFVPDDSSCYYCCKLKELTESNQDLSLAAVRQLIIELYHGLFRYQVWDLQTGKPFLDDVFNKGSQLNPFAYFCCLSSWVVDAWFLVLECSDFNKAVSVFNIAVITAVYFLLNLGLERCANGQLPDIPGPKWEQIQEDEDYREYVLQRLEKLAQNDFAPSTLRYCLAELKVGIYEGMKNPKMLPNEWLEGLYSLHRLANTIVGGLFLQFFHDLFRDSDFSGHFPTRFLDLHGKNTYLSLSPGKSWIIKDLPKCMGINVNNSSGTEHKIMRVNRFTFTNDDHFVLYSDASSPDSSLHAMSLRTGTRFTSVTGCSFVRFKREKQVGYLFRSGDKVYRVPSINFGGDEEKVLALFLKDLFSPFKFVPGLPSQKRGSGVAIAAVFISSNTVACINSDLMISTYVIDDTCNAFYIKSDFRSILTGNRSVQAPRLRKKYVSSPDGNSVAFQQENKIEILCGWKSQGFQHTVFEADFSITDAFLKFSCDSSLLFFCIYDNFKGPCFYVWDVRNQAMSSSFESPGLLTVDGFCLSPDTSRFVLCGGDNEIEIWEFNKHPCRLLTRIGVERFYSSVKFSQCTVSLDNELLACCIGDVIVLFNLLLADVLSSKQILRGHVGKIEFCKFLKVNRYLISYAVDGILFLWDTTSSKAIGFARITYGKETMTSMAVSPKEDRVICFLSSNQVCVINLCNLDSAVFSKSLSTLTRGKVHATESREQLTEQMPSSAIVPTSSFEDHKSEASSNSDSEEDFDITEDYFFESDESE